MSRDLAALTRALLAASPADRLRALTPLLAAVDEVLDDFPPGMGRGHGASTAALVDAWARGEAIDEDALAHELQVTAWRQRDLGEDAHTRGFAGDASLLLGHVALVQVALVDVLGLDFGALLTRAVADPDDDEGEAIALFDLEDLGGEPAADERFAVHLGGTVLDLDGYPAIDRALAEVLRRLQG